MDRQLVPKHPGITRRSWLASDGRREVRYDATFRGPDRKKHTRSFAKLGDAGRWLRDQRSGADRGTWFDPALGRRRFGDFAEAWFQTTTHLRPSSRARTEITLRKHLLPRFGARSLATITPIDVRSFVSDLVSTGLAPATVAKVYNVLRPILRAAEETGHIGRSPCIGVKLPTAQRGEMRFLGPEEIERLATAVPERYRALILVGAWGGLRFSELAGIRLEHADFLRRRITVIDTIVEVSGRLHEGPTKGGRGRVVTLPAFVVENLSAHIAAFPPGPDGLVFTSPQGGPLRRSAFRSRVWIPAIKRAGLQGLRPHDLRHTAAALAIAAGAHPKAIQERLGHASITTTLDRYGHLFPEIDQELADRLNAMQQLKAQGSTGPTK